MKIAMMVSLPAGTWFDRAYKGSAFSGFTCVAASFHDSIVRFACNHVGPVVTWESHVHGISSLCVPCVSKTQFGSLDHRATRAPIASRQETYGSGIRGRGDCENQRPIRVRKS
jgi:hypothetical protein